MLRKENYKDLDKWRSSKNRQRKRYYKKTQNANNSGRRWSSEEIKIVLEHKMSDSEISKLIGRSVGAIQSRRFLEKRKTAAKKENN